MAIERLTEHELAQPLEEATNAAVIVPKQGKLLDEEGRLKVAVIRPCMSRGRKIRGLPPIYEARMLAQNAGVFGDWPMYFDHASEELAEAIYELLQEKGRSVRDLSGRILPDPAPYFDPELTFEDDEEYGFRPGGIVAFTRPRRAVREMLEDDPGLLHTSINAFPSGGHPGNPSWDNAKRGMVIEGIRSKPRGSVDWVYRGGAGGRPLVEEERQRILVAVEHALEEPEDAGGDDPARGDNGVVAFDLKNVKSREDLVKGLQEEGREDLIELLPEEGKEPKPDGNGGLTEERLVEILDERDEKRDQKLQEERETERELSRLERIAHKAVEESVKNGLPKGWEGDLKRRYSTLSESGALRIQESELEDDKTSDDVIRERVKDDVKLIVERLRESGADPRVKGLGSQESDDEKPAAPKDSLLRERLERWGVVKPDEDKSVDDQITEAFKE